MCKSAVYDALNPFCVLCNVFLAYLHTFAVVETLQIISKSGPEYLTMHETCPDVTSCSMFPILVKAARLIFPSKVHFLLQLCSPHPILCYYSHKFTS